MRTYGRHPGQWLGYAGILVSTILNRVVVIIIMAEVASNIAAGDMEQATRQTLYFLAAYMVGVILWTASELFSVWVENHEYEDLTLKYHRKLIGKDLAFYRDNQTGYLATVFRQHLDSAMLLMRFFRGEALGTTVSLVAPVVVLCVVNIRICL